MKSWKTPTPEQIEKVVARLGHPEQRRYFFDHLENPLWIKPLSEKGFFNTPPQTIRDEDRGTISFPPWFASRYLARMASQAPEAVLEVILQIPDTDNVRIHEDLTDAALAMPAELAAQIVPEAKKWVKVPYQVLLPEKLGSLVGYLARGGQGAAALELARVLFSIQAGPRKTFKTEDGEMEDFGPEIYPLFEKVIYKEILEKHAADLIEPTQEEGLVLFCNLLDSAILLSRRREEDHGPQDYSYIWHPSIENRGRGHLYDVKNLLVVAVRDAAEQILRADPSKTQTVIEKIERYSWNIFQRLALHLLRRFSDTNQQFTSAHLLYPVILDQSGCECEYRTLLREHFPSLSTDEQSQWLRLIENGPPRPGNVSEGQESPEEREEYAVAWRRGRLAAIVDILPTPWKEQHGEWVQDLSPPSDSDPISVSWEYGPSSPKSAEDFRSMPVGEIVSFLGSWQWSGDPLLSPEGLGGELSRLVHSDPERFAVNAGLFQGLDPTSVRSLLSGLVKAVKEKKSFAWQPVLELCLWIVRQPREIPGRKSQYSDLDPGWVWTRKRVAELLSEGFAAGAAQAEIPFQLRQLAWKVLEPITDDPDPEPNSMEGQNPADQSINTTRGEAMHAVVHYALWVRRKLGELSGGGGEKGSFDGMPEVQKVLDEHLRHDTAPAIRAVYGQWLPQLAFLNQAWVTAHLSDIFPIEESQWNLRDAAWETYIIFCPPYTGVFDILQEEYSRAVDRLGGQNTKWRNTYNPEEHLADHLMTLYAHGSIALDELGSLIINFYKKASDELRGYAVETEGRRLCDTREKVPPEILNRLKALWEYRLAEAKAATSSSSHTRELSAFGWWFASGQFEDDWALDHLTEVLRIVGTVDAADRDVVERLADLVTLRPKQVVVCLRLMVEGAKESWRVQGWRDSPWKILQTAINGSDPEAQKAAIDLVHQLGKHGHFEYRELLPREAE